jgi:hypothetical protein
MRFDLKELKRYEQTTRYKPEKKLDIEKLNIIEINGTIQKVFVKSFIGDGQYED